jgi:hypothetical protein
MYSISKLHYSPIQINKFCNSDDIYKPAHINKTGKKLFIKKKGKIYEIQKSNAFQIIKNF